MVVLGLWVYTTFNEANAFTNEMMTNDVWFHHGVSITVVSHEAKGIRKYARRPVTEIIIKTGKCIGFVKSCINP